MGSIIENNLAKSCTEVTGNSETSSRFNSCTEALNHAGSAFNIYEISVTRYHTKRNHPQLESLRNSWSRYLEKSRSQTIVDVWFSTVVQHNHYKQKKLVKPHPRQYFLLRPGFVYQYYPNADKGDRNSFGLSMEWLGVNWWDARIPFGISMISTHTSFLDGDSTGLGIQLTIDNSYSLGWVNRDSNNGIFLSVDLLKLWDDKTTRLEQYKKDPWAWLRN